MIRDPLGRLPTRLRLALAAALSLVALGLPWRTDTWAFGGCGSPGVCEQVARSVGADSPTRLFLVGAFLALAVVAARTRTPGTRRIARAGTGCLAVGAVLAAADRSVPVLICTLAGLALSAPPAWRNRPVFGTAPLGR